MLPISSPLQKCFDLCCVWAVKCIVEANHRCVVEVGKSALDFEPYHGGNLLLFGKSQCYSIAIIPNDINGALRT